MKKIAAAFALLLVIPSLARAEVREFQLVTNLANGRLWIDTSLGTVTDSDLMVLGGLGTPENPNNNYSALTHITGALAVYDHTSPAGTSSYISIGSWRSTTMFLDFIGNWRVDRSWNNTMSLVFDYHALVGLDKDLDLGKVFPGYSQGPAWNWYGGAGYGSWLYREESGDEHHEGDFMPVSGSLLVPEPSSIVLGMFAMVGLVAVAIRRRLPAKATHAT